MGKILEWRGRYNQVTKRRRKKETTSDGTTFNLWRDVRRPNETTAQTRDRMDRFIASQTGGRMPPGPRRRTYGKHGVKPITRFRGGAWS